MKKIVLAYSGGLDTSCLTKWLADRYDAEVICFSAFLGEVKDPKVLKKRAHAAGSKKVYVEDLKKVFADEYVLPALWAHARYEGQYPLATAIGRPLIAKRLAEIAEKEGATAVAHGCTAKGNDQVRIEVGVRTLNPKLEILAPLREWDLKTREDEIDYAAKHKIPIGVTKKSPYSIDKNIWGIAIEAGILEDLWQEPPEDAYVMTKHVSKTPKHEYVTIDFKNGKPVKLNGKTMGFSTLIEKLNVIAGRNGVGRFDMVENRLIGIKSREIYEAPAAEVLIKAHEELEGLVMDREFLHYKRVLSEKYSELVYFGLWFSPLKQALDAFFALNQKLVTGRVRFKLEKGHVRPAGRESKNSLYSHNLATYSKGDQFDHKSATGFMKLWGLPYEGMGKKLQNNRKK